MTRQADQRHRRFVNALIKHNFVAKHAYQEVYPDADDLSAESASARLMGEAHIQQMLKERMDELEIKELVTIEKVLLRLNREAEELNSRPADRIRANELLGKYLRMFGDEGNNVQVNVIGKDELAKIRANTGRKKAVSQDPTVYEGKDENVAPEPSNKKLEASKQEDLNDSSTDVNDSKNVT